jgi:large subunit ribosomal protein L19e
MQLERIKAIAAQLLNVGKNKVWVNPKENQKASEAMTKEDVRSLIGEGVITKKKTNAHSRGRARILAIKKKKGRKSGMGKRKGTKKARVKTKETWIKNVRAQRRTLKELKEKNPEAIEAVGYSTMYKRVKGNYFKGKKYVEAFVLEHGKRGRS